MTIHQIYNKQHIAHSFSRAAATYDQAAILQHEVANYLLGLFDKYPFNPQQIIDLGSGTGSITQHLIRRFPTATCMAIDIAHGMLQHSLHNVASPNIHWVCGDAEQLPVANEYCDLIFSNLMLQWSSNYQISFKELARILKTTGQIVFSSLGPNTLYELADCWTKIDFHPRVHPFFTQDDLKKALLLNGLELIHFEIKNVVRYHAQLIDLMRELKNIGARNSLTNRDKGMLSKGKFQSVQQAYERYRNDQGLLPATYEVFYVIAKKNM